MTLLKVNNHPVQKSFSGLVEDIFNDGSLNKWFKDDWSNYNLWSKNPPVNIHETKDAYTLDVVAPGFEKADFKNNVEAKTLTVSAEKKEEKTEDGKKQVRKEFSYRSFQRSFTLDDAIDTEKINAKYENGVLALTLPKKEDSVEKAKEITVE